MHPIGVDSEQILQPVGTFDSPNICLKFKAPEYELRL